ncbi:hypothetical protein HC761_01325 [bacterium]|nr:hypothetical protein [bacterium]
MQTANLFIRGTWSIWAKLIVPLASAIIFAYLMQLERTDKKWDYWRALSIPIWQIYLSKLVVVVAWTLLSALSLALCSAIMLYVLAVASPDTLLQVFRLAFVSSFGLIWLLSVYWLLALRFESLSLLFAVAIFGTFASLMLQHLDAEWAWILPWTEPLIERNVLAISLRNFFGTTSVVALGLLMFSSRPVGQ